MAGNAKLARLVATTGAIGGLAAEALGSKCSPVRAILFDKTASTNWALGWHQDRTIAVCERLQVPGFGPWTVKQGLLHVEPPFSVIEAMVTARVHLDAVPEDNAPLLIAPGSHLLGRLAEADIEAAVTRCGTAMCTASRGDVWLYRTPILHASETSRSVGRRRVLQIDFTAVSLPGGLRWLGI